MTNPIHLQMIQQVKREAGCNGNCMQGRACDCVRGYYPEPPKEPMTAADLRWLLALAAVAILVAVGVVALVRSYF